jgi:hypothetical protein
VPLLLAALCLAVGALRPFVPPQGLTWPGAYKDAAHMLVGALVALLCVGWHRRPCAVALGLLTLVEVACFLTR